MSSSSSSSRDRSDLSGRSLIDETKVDDEWITRMREMRLDRSLAVRIMSFVSGGPGGVTVIVMKKAPRCYDDSPDRTSELSGQASQLFWVVLRGVRRRSGGRLPRHRGRSAEASPTYRTRDGHDYATASAGVPYGPRAYATGAQASIPAGAQHGGMNRQAPPPGIPGGIPTPAYTASVMPPQPRQGGA